MRRVKSLSSVLSHLKPLREHFENWRAVSISFRAIEAYITKRREDDLRMASQKTTIYVDTLPTKRV